MIFRLDRVLFIVLSLLIFGCSEGSIGLEYDPDADVELVSIAALREQSSTNPQKITGETYIEGRVVSSDDSRNIWNSIYITDLTGTAEIRVIDKYLYKLFPYGSKIRVSCNSLHMYLYNGVLTIGLDREKYWVTSIPNDRISVYLESLTSPIEVITLRKTIGELSANTLGYYVNIRGVQFKDSELGTYWTDPDIVTERALVDQSGDTLAVRTLPSATFALYPLPSGSGSIGGILIFDGDEYQLIVTNYQDVKMRSPRF